MPPGEELADHMLHRLEVDPEHHLAVVPYPDVLREGDGGATLLL